MPVMSFEGLKGVKESPGHECTHGGAMNDALSK